MRRHHKHNASASFVQSRTSFAIWIVALVLGCLYAMEMNLPCLRGNISTREGHFLSLLWEQTSARNRELYAPNERWIILSFHWCPVKVSEYSSKSQDLFSNSTIHLFKFENQPSVVFQEEKSGFISMCIWPSLVGDSHLLEWNKWGR